MVVQRRYTALVVSRCDSADTISVPQSLVHISPKYLTVRVPVQELKLLERYCKNTRELRQMLFGNSFVHWLLQERKAPLNRLELSMYPSAAPTEQRGSNLVQEGRRQGAEGRKKGYTVSFLTFFNWVIISAALH
jgi:hypothetical protein